MKPKDHQDIIKQMADRLREHSVPYQEGAWERFKGVEKKKPRLLVLWPYLSAAAAILIAVVLFLKPEQQFPITNEFVEENSQNGGEHKEGKALIEQGESNLIARSTEKNIDFQPSGTKQHTKIAVVSATVVEKESLKDSRFQNEEDLGPVKQKEMTAYHSEETVVGKNAVVEKAIEEPALASVVKKEEKKESVDFLTALSTMEENKNFIENRDMDKKWSMGLDVSPNISSNNQVNMGGGIAIAYSVSSKVSISSGISYLQLGTEQMPHAPSRMGSPEMGLSAPSTAPSDDILRPQKGVYLASGTRVKTLNKTAANLIGFDIPLTVNYHVSKNFYASAGVSVFNVLNEERTNQYENQEVEVSYSGTGNATPEPMYRTFYSNEVVGEKQYQGKGLSGFYNFSIGYSIPVSKRVGLAIEPFFKIPINTFRDEDMNLSNGGIKISTRF